MQTPPPVFLARCGKLNQNREVERKNSGHGFGRFLTIRGMVKGQNRRGKRCVVIQHAWQGRGFARPLHPTRAGGFRAPLHPRRGTRPGSCDLTQPYADWMCGNGVSRCIDSHAFAPGTTTRGVPAPSTQPNRAPVGCAATACPVASTFGAFPQNPASGVSPPDTSEQERGPCTPIHDRPAGQRAIGNTGGVGPGGDLFAGSIATGAAAGKTEARPPHRQHEGAAFRAASGFRSARCLVTAHPMHSSAARGG